MTTNSAPDPAPVLDVRDLGHSYEVDGHTTRIIQGLTFKVRPDEFICIVGPSGVGKTTLLRCLAGLQRPTEGSILVEGAQMTGPSDAIGLVFQDYSRSLLPWLTVLENAALPLRSRFNRAERRERAAAALAQVGLEGALKKYPWQLSGGMQQRVAIARALVFEPRVLLMDEPFASVDAQTREDLEDLVRRVREQDRRAVVLITHDIDEAVYLADRLLVLDGRPAAIAEEIEVPLGDSRDQITTKERREFIEVRSQVHRLIKR